MKRRPTGRRQTAGTSEYRVSIRPGVSVLSVLRHLKYQPWFALAEFVDNSVESYLECRLELQRLHGRNFKLEVSIEIDPQDKGRIVVRDNAGGIREADFPRAFRPAEIPPDRSGLSEFGMGMKSAACWFAPNWTVRTSALGEAMVKVVAFDIDRIVNDQIEELAVEVRAGKPETHFTEITLWNLHNCPTGRSLAKIKEHLADIYRVFLRDNVLTLKVKGEAVQYKEPSILIAPQYDENNAPAGRNREWKKQIAFDFGNGLEVKGFAALRDPGSTSHAGFSLFRRNRLIVGSADEKYRPQIVFGHSNDYVFQRLFGELHLRGFSVTHTKDGFRWDENEQPFLEVLKEKLNAKDMPLLDQARNYRARRSKKEIRQVSEWVIDRTARAIERKVEPVLGDLASQPVAVPVPRSLAQASIASKRVIDIDFEERRWRIVVELSDDAAVGDWLEISEDLTKREPSGGRELVGIRISVVHPFMDRFAALERDRLEPLVRFGAALALSEKLARDSGVRYASAIRTRVNKLLLEAFSKV